MIIYYEVFSKKFLRLQTGKLTYYQTPYGWYFSVLFRFWLVVSVCIITLIVRVIQHILIKLFGSWLSHWFKSTSLLARDWAIIALEWLLSAQTPITRSHVAFYSTEFFYKAFICYLMKNKFWSDLVKSVTCHNIICNVGKSLLYLYQDLFNPV